MDARAIILLDLDHVVMNDGQIYRVVGNLDDRTRFLGYNIYSPNSAGDRLYRGQRYKKNFLEDERLPTDVLDTYQLLATNDIVEHHDPVQSAQLNRRSFSSTVWFDLYSELVDLVGEGSVGIFGSSMFGFHLTPEGNVRKDVDFVIEWVANVKLLRRELSKIQDKLGFTVVTVERQLQQYDRYQRVFRNRNNSIRSIVARRWTSLQLSEHVVTTIRLRDPSFTIPVDLVTAPMACLANEIVSGRVADADGSNLFPRKFTVITQNGDIDAYILWWKFSTPVREGDAVTLCGSLLILNGRVVIRLTDFCQHWLRIDDHPQLPKGSAT